MYTTITKQQVRTLVETTVREHLREIFRDPDFGLHLTQRTERRLHSANRNRAHRTLRSADEIITRLRLPI